MLQVNGVTIAIATPQPLQLSSAPIWTPPDVVGVYALGPVEVLASGVQFQVTVFGNAQSHSVEGFQLRVEFETNLMHVLAVEPSGLFQCAPLTRKCSYYVCVTGMLQKLMSERHCAIALW